MGLKKHYTKDMGGATFLNGQIYRIPATSDFMFKNLFGVNGKEKNLKWLLQAILKIKIKSLHIQNPELPRETKESKKGILDIRAMLEDGTSILVEMQVKDEKNLGERAVFYLCKLFVSTIENKGQYNEMDKAIAIIITDFSYFNRNEYHQIAHLKFEECTDKNEMVDTDDNITDKLTDKIELHIIDLKKFKKIKEPKGELAEWLNLLIGNEGGIEMATRKNKALAKVNLENVRLSAQMQMQEDYWNALKGLLDENTRKSIAEKEAKQKREDEKRRIKKEKEIEEKEKAIEEKEKTIEEKGKKIEEKEKTIEEKGKKIEEKEKTIEEKEKTIEKAQNKLEEVQQEFEKAQQKFEEEKKNLEESRKKIEEEKKKLDEEKRKMEEEKRSQKKKN